MTEQDAEVEELHKRFPGRIWQLYYSEEGDQLYGNYNPSRICDDAGWTGILLLGRLLLGKRRRTGAYVAQSFDHSG